MKKFSILIIAILLFSFSAFAQTSSQLVPGNLGKAKAELNQPNNYLVEQSSFILSNSKERDVANWDFFNYKPAPAVENGAILQGRIFRAESQSISSSGKVLVKLVCDSSQETKWTVSNNSGYFFFGNLQIGDFCTATAQRVGYHFVPAGGFRFLVFQSLIQGVDFSPFRD